VPTLPKGGGAIRGIGEKFAANPVMGTGSVSVPLVSSPGRSGVGPKLTLSYDSGAGNGPFGFGWHLLLGSIVRKTDRGLPQFHDAEDSDVFIHTGNDDLVPALIQTAAGDWVRDTPTPRVVNGVPYRVSRYLPRVEGTFARIECWNNEADARDVFWRSISRDNVTTWYGRTPESRIADPSNPSRIFAWLTSESYDDKGNLIAYEYKNETSEKIDALSAHERNRTDTSRGANSYIRRIRYGNQSPYFIDLMPASGWPALPTPDQWHFEIVFDYGEYDAAAPAPETEVDSWMPRVDPFSSYRSGFEIRTYRLCQRVLMFHRFAELGAEPCLVTSTDFTYNATPLATYLSSVAQSGYTRQAGGTYLKKSLPPVEFFYSEVSVADTTKARHIDWESELGLPEGIDEARFSMVDLDGEGLPGILSREGGDWFYKRNLSPITRVIEDGREVTVAAFDATKSLPTLPSLAVLPHPHQHLLSLGGDGALDVVDFHHPTPGRFERKANGTWRSFVPFRSLPNVNWNDPNLRFFDLTGDGLADIAVTDDDVLVWYPSLGVDGFGAAAEVRQVLDEERGPRCLFGDPDQLIFLADMSGDGLADIVRVKSKETCYWPNLGYGRFGAKVTMDNAPALESPGRFHPSQIRLADIDGTGVADLIFLAHDGPRLYFNQSGNRWSDATVLSQCPPIDSTTSVIAADLLGNGTACLVWSSPHRAHEQQPLRYIELMEQKPHLLIGMRNNMGAETRVEYEASTKFYRADELAGRPWATRIPFPVHVVTRVETIDWISRNRFVTQYAYHDGYFDRTEREFHGFGCVEQFDTEQFAALSATGDMPSENIDAASHVPPVRTVTWFHTGAFLEHERIEVHFARGYFGAPSRNDPAYPAKFNDFMASLLPPPALPTGITAAEVRQAYRALKGQVLRQEVYGLDGSADADIPYAVSERSYAIDQLQPTAGNPHNVVFVHGRETLNAHYERHVGDARIAHDLVLAVDRFGNVERSVSIAYARRAAPPALPEQACTHVTAAVRRFVNRDDALDWYRVGVAVETRTFELVKPPEPEAGAARLQFDKIQSLIEVLFPPALDAPPATQTIPSESWSWRDAWNPALEPGGPGVSKLRLIGHTRTYYRADNLSGALPLGSVESLALPHETYALALTPGIVTAAYGARVSATMLADEGQYVHTEGDANWWSPSGRTFLSPNPADTPALELAYGRAHFFLPRRYRDPFHTAAISTEVSVDYDMYDLFAVRNEDPVGNVTTARIDYRVLEPSLIVNANGNRTEAVFDTLGMVAGTAIMGKVGDGLGDSLAGFDADLSDAQTQAFIDAADPHGLAAGLLKSASTRVVYDVNSFYRSRTLNPDPSTWEPMTIATLAREMHVSSPLPPEGLRIHLTFSISDGFGREIQKKVEAEPGPLVDGGWIATPRWVGSGWTVFDNKAQPVRQYEPFFTASHKFEFARAIGVSSVLMYDPPGRVVATMHPNHSYEKAQFDAWQHSSWDTHDTLTLDPSIDPDVKDRFTRLPSADYLPTWYQRASVSPDVDLNNAALRSLPHVNTPAIAHVDPLGRTFLTIADNGAAGAYATRVVLDVEGNHRQVVDALGRVAVRIDYDLMGNEISHTSMDAGSRWVLSDVAGHPVRGWDDRGFVRRTTYDPLRRLTGIYVADAAGERLAEQTTYGESKAAPESTNHRGRVWQVRDGAGIATNETWDFRGRLLQASRALRANYSTPVDWNLPPAPAAETFTSSSTYDALDRVIESTAPDGSVIVRRYNEANLLDRIDVRLPGAAIASPIVRSIDYNAKGQRTRIDYNSSGAPVVTLYEYEALTFRLARILTVRPNHPDALKRTLQDLRYTHDAIGNITHVQDLAQQTIYFRNRIVEPSQDYRYDALYRVIEAHGREHLGQVAAPTPPDALNTFHIAQAHPGDGNAMGTYVERHTYDAVGNVTLVKHNRTDVAVTGWTRTYDYTETSLIEPARNNNRLSRTVVAGSVPSTEPYQHDAHGNMIAMPHLPAMRWDFEDQLTQVDLVGGGTAYYVYDAGGQRMRKVIERLGTTVEERIYLGGFEVYRKRVGGLTTLERETLHVMADRQHVAMVETRTQGAGDSPSRLVRYQFGNHLGSAVLELDEAAKLISYEEYFPYGSSSYQAVDGMREVPVKRYRYVGKERDEETGLSYHGARYYSPWLGRWTSCDPLGVGAGPNLYAYVNGRPIIRLDPDGLIDKSAQLWLYEQKQFGIAPVARADNRGISPQQHAALRGLNYGFGPGNIKLHWLHPDDQPFVTQPAGTRVTLAPGPGKENVEKAPEAGEARSQAVQAGKFTRVYIDKRSRDLTVPPGTRFKSPPPEPFEKPLADYAKAFEKRAAAAPEPSDTGAAKSSPAVPAAAAGASGEQVELNLQQRLGTRPPVPAAGPAVSAASRPPAAGPGVVARLQASASAAAQAVKGNPGAVAKGVGAAAGGAVVRTFVPGAAETLDSVAMVGVRGTVSMAGSAIGRPLLVAGAGAAGIYAGFKIQEHFPQYSQHAAEVGSHFEAAASSVPLIGSKVAPVVGGAATVAATLPLVWAETKAVSWLFSK
jgi:RHS repeat-associated protein